MKNKKEEQTNKQTNKHTKKNPEIPFWSYLPLGIANVCIAIPTKVNEFE